MGVAVSIKELEQLEKEGKGTFDADGFLILNDGGYYDPWGYKFSHKDKDENGNEIWKDDYGGYYGVDGNYVPGPEY
jgi:hypothetical protein